MNNDSKKWIIVLAAGIIAVLAGIMVYLSDKNVADNYTGTTTATVVDYVEEEEFSTSLDTIQTVYAPVLTYTVDGTEYTEQYSQHYSELPYAIGDSVEIKYDPSAPASYSITEDSRGSFIVLWEVPVGIILIILALFKLLKK